MKSIIKPYVISLIVFWSSSAFSEETIPSSYISNLMGVEFADRENFHTFITFEMLNQWLNSLGSPTYKRNRYTQLDEPAELICGMFSAREMLECGTTVLSMYRELTSARLKLIGRDYDEVYRLSEAHNEYSELICSLAIERDYGDLVNSYRMYEMTFCELRHLKQFNEELEGYHGAMFR